MINRYALLEHSPWGSILEINPTLHVHLIQSNGLTSAENSALNQFLQNYRLTKKVHLIQLWEVEYQLQKELIDTMLDARNGKYNQIHARKCVVKIIEPTIARSFLEHNHVLVTADLKTAKKPTFSIAFGLEMDGRLVALATFGKPIQKTKSYDHPFFSGEMIHFCNLRGYRVYGGLDKLLKHYARSFELDDIMTYSDNAWSDGKVYEKLGFEKKGIFEPIAFELLNGKRIRIITPKDNERYIWNSGSIKYVTTKL